MRRQSVQDVAALPIGGLPGPTRTAGRGHAQKSRVAQTVRPASFNETPEDLDGRTEMTKDRMEKIRERAYELWEVECCPEGRALDHWLCAEAEVLEGAEAEVAAKPPAREVRRGRK